MTSLKAGSGTLPNGPFGSSNLRHWPCLAISCCLGLGSEYAFHPNDTYIHIPIRYAKYDLLPYQYFNRKHNYDNTEKINDPT